STSDGTTPVDVSQRAAWSHQLTAAQAAAYTVGNIFSPEGGYAWYGFGYPGTDQNNLGTGSANPSDPNYIWPAFWGDRNSNNDTANTTVSAVYPLPGNPTAYSDPSWTLTSNWDPDAQFKTIGVPEPASVCLLALGGLMVFAARKRLG